MTSTFHRPLLAALLLAASGCVAEDQLTDTATGALDVADVPEGSDDALAIIAVANTGTLAELDDAPPAGAGLDRRAAENLVAKRPFATLAAVDAVPYVGPAALDRLLERAHLLDLVGDHETGADRHGVVEGSDEAAGLLELANLAPAAELADPAKVGLDPAAVAGLVAARPFASLAAVDAVPRVGPVSFEKLRSYAWAHGWVPTWRDLFPIGAVDKRVAISIPATSQQCTQSANPPFNTWCYDPSPGPTSPGCKITGTNPGPIKITCGVAAGWLSVSSEIAADGSFWASGSVGGWYGQMAGRFDSQGVVFTSWKKSESWNNVYNEWVTWKLWSTAEARGKVVNP